MLRPWAILFGLFIVFVIAVADTGHIGLLGRVYAFPNGDKVGHFVLFGLLSLVLSLSAFEARPGDDKRRLAILVSLALAAFVGLEEYSQRYFPTRHADILDFLASCAGVAFFAWLAVRLKA